MAHTIFPATLSDAPDILALQRLAYQSEARLYGDWNIAPLTQTLAELEAEFARLALLKAVSALGVIGSVRAGQTDGVCSIGRLIVHPDHQRQGLGTALLEAIEAAFPQAARYALFTGSRSLGNIRLYQRQGYQTVRSQTLTPQLTLVFLEKPGPAWR